MDIKSVIWMGFYSKMVYRIIRIAGMAIVVILAGCCFVLGCLMNPSLI